jgi:hypothetical protein
VPEWDLTDALDAGDATKAIVVARRMLDSKSRAGLQIVNILQRHYLRMARLEGSGVRSEEEAASVLGINKYPAGKALRISERLGAQLLHHQPRRPRQVDPVGPDPRDHRGRRPRLMREQYLDSMDIERERGITIKAQNVRVLYTGPRPAPDRHPRPRRLRLRGQPLAGRLRGGVLLVDASQGIQAQTLANCYQAIENDLEIVAVLNKIDLPAADPSAAPSRSSTCSGLAAETSCTSRPRPARGCPSCSTPSSSASRPRRATPTPRCGR